MPWQFLLDVVNCARYGDDILREETYCCPTTGGSYQHRQSKYFGSYRNKTVEIVALIKAVVDVHSAVSASVVWKTVDEPTESLLHDALERHRVLRPNQFPKRLFLLAAAAKTDFRKDTIGGMQSSKRYFDVSRLAPTDVRDLAAKLRTCTWSNF
jgi:hypothetical protein